MIDLFKDLNKEQIEASELLPTYRSVSFLVNIPNRTSLSRL